MYSQTKEVFINGKKVDPGFCYNIGTREFSPNKKGEVITIKEQPISFQFDFWSTTRLDTCKRNSVLRNSIWMTDYIRSNAVDAIMVKGVKVLEKKGIEVPLDTEEHRVTSVLWKSHCDLLMEFSKNVVSEDIEQLREYLQSVVCKSNESFIPQAIRNKFKCAYIYRNVNEKGKLFLQVKHCLEAFCHVLAESKLGTEPITALVKAPCPVNIATSVASSTGEDSLKFDEVGYKVNFDVNVKTDAKPEVHSKIRANQQHGHSEQFSSEIGKVHRTVRANRDYEPVAIKIRTAGRGFGTKVGRGYGKVDSKSESHVGKKSSFIEEKGTSSIHQSCTVINTSTIGSAVVLGVKKVEPEVDTLESLVTREPSYSVNLSVNECFDGCAMPRKLKGSEGNSDIQVSKIVTKQNMIVLGNSNERTDDLELSAHPVNIPSNLLKEEIKEVKSELKHRDHTTNVKKCDRVIQCDKVIQTESINRGHAENINNDEKNTLDRDFEEKKENIHSLSQEKVVEKKDSYKNSMVTERRKSVNEQHHPDMKPQKDVCQDLKDGNTICKDKGKNGSKDSGVGGAYDCNMSIVGSDGKADPVREPKRTTAVKCAGKDGKADPGKEPKRMTEGKYTGKDGKADSVEELKRTTTDQFMSEKSVYFSGYGTPSTTASSQKRLYHGILASGSDKSSLDSTVPVTVKRQKGGKEKPKIPKSKLLKPEKVVHNACGFEHKYYGCESEHLGKVLLLLGASGSGKTMLINSFANFFLDKKKADDDLVHVENTLPTSTIDGYTFCSSSGENPFTVIDTPGLNDSSGAEVQDHIQTLKTFLANASAKGCEIHAIGFVVQAHLVRLTSSERLVMDYISTLFGRSVSEHLITLVTFADYQETPQVIEAMKNYGVNFNLFLKFNNSALSNCETEEIDDLDRAYWKICMKNWRKCFKVLKDMSALSVNTMKAVQHEVYVATVVEAAERDLCTELNTFFMLCKKDGMSKEALEICIKIWELVAIVCRLRKSENFAYHTIHNILVEYAVDVCKKQSISPSKYVSYLSLNPLGSLVVSGSEIIRTMAPICLKGRHHISNTLSKCIVEWSYCHGCEKEHKMKRYQASGMKKYLGPSTDVLALTCSMCSCPGNVHGVSKVESPFGLDFLLQHTRNSLKKSLDKYSFKEYALCETAFIQFLNEYLYFEHDIFIGDLLKLTDQVNSST